VSAGANHAERGELAPVIDESVEPFAEPVRSVRTFETAIEHIIDGIERRRLRRGERLPNETDLARQLGLSKPTLRQALRVLERSGLLTVKQGKAGGIFLSSDYLPTEAISTNIAAEEDGMVETLRARRVIEGAIAREALYAATDEDLEELRRTMDLLLVDGLRIEDLLRADTMFHRAVARGAHNRVLEQSLQSVYRYFEPIRSAYQSADQGQRVRQIHEIQLLAMQARDPVALDLALDQHFRYTEERFALALGHTWEDLFDQPIGPGGLGGRLSGLASAAAH
jgi:GntR family transcriptional repressor for pyruvate dehydrogenase complex